MKEEDLALARALVAASASNKDSDGVPTKPLRNLLLDKTKAFR